MSTRRHFLALTSAAAAASALPGTLRAQFPTEVFSNANLGAYAQGLLTQSTFERNVGSVFKAFHPDRNVSYLTLLAVIDMTPAAVSARRSAASQSHVSGLQKGALAAGDSPSFDLAFAVSGPAIVQQSYTLDHGILGRFVAFLVPGLSSNGGNTCGASFNYLTGPAPRTTHGPVTSPIITAPIAASPGAASPVTASPVELPGTGDTLSPGVTARVVRSASPL